MIKITDSVEIPLGYTGIAEYPDGFKKWVIEWFTETKRWIAEHPDGTKCWVLNGKLHRVDGPAIIKPDGTKQWYLNNRLHREDGPACEWPDGGRSWWLNDELLFGLPPKSQPFIIIEEFINKEGKEKIKVLNQKGIEIWPCVPGLKELADNWEGVKQ